MVVILYRHPAGTLAGVSAKRKSSANAATSDYD